MSINCNIVRNPLNNNVERVNAPNGEESILYKSALKKFNDAKTALNVWAVSSLTSFKEQVRKPSFLKDEVNSEGTKIKYTSQGNLVVLEEIKTNPDFRGRGLARKALQDFLVSTDEVGATVKLVVSPRDATTDQNKLEEFYMSEGFNFDTENGIPSSFEMVRYPNVQRKKFDKNGEPLLKTVIEFIESNKETEPLSQKDIFDIEDMIIAEGLTDSSEILKELDLIFKNGDLNVLFLQNSKIFSDSEVANIVENKDYQKELKELRNKLSNLDSPIVVSYFIEEPFILMTGEVNKFGKNAIVNPLEVQEDLNQALGGISDIESFSDAVNDLDYPEIIEKYNSSEDMGNEDISEEEDPFAKWENKKIEGREGFLSVEETEGGNRVLDQEFDRIFDAIKEENPDLPFAELARLVRKDPRTKKNEKASLAIKNHNNFIFSGVIKKAVSSIDIPFFRDNSGTKAFVEERIKKTLTRRFSLEDKAYDLLKNHKDLLKGKNLEDLAKDIIEAFFPIGTKFNDLTSDERVKAGKITQSIVSDFKNEIQKGVLENTLNNPQSVKRLLIGEEKKSNQGNFKFRLFSQFSGLSKMQVLNTDISNAEAPNRLSTIKETLNLDGSNFTEDIELLNQAEDFWSESRSEIIDGLTEIEEKGIEASLDLEGLVETYDSKDSEEILTFLDSLSTLEQSVTQENFDDFLKQYKQFFSVETMPLFNFEKMAVSHKDKTLIKMEDSNSNEYDMFNEHSMVKVSPGIYQRVQKVSFEDMLEITYAEASSRDNRILPNEAYFINSNSANNAYLRDESNKQVVMDNIRLFVEDNVGSMDLGKEQYDFDVAYNLYLYKQVFENPITVKIEGLTQYEQKSVEDFKGNYNFLTDGFISEFQKKKLMERRLDSEKFKEVYNYFEINSLGIIPKYQNIATKNRVEEAAKRLLTEKEFQELSDYFRLNKNNSFFEGTYDPTYIPSLKAIKLAYQNDPSKLAPYKGDYQKVKDAGVTTFEASDSFIRINSRLYQKTEEEQGQPFYEQIPTFNSEFFVLEDTGEVNKFGYNTVKNYIRSQQNTESKSNKYSSEELESINENNFDCN
jgi:hypothetical protein